MVKAVVTELVLVENHELTAEEKEELDFFESVRRRKKAQQQQQTAASTSDMEPSDADQSIAAPAPPAPVPMQTSYPPVPPPAAPLMIPQMGSRKMAQPLTKMMVMIPQGVVGGMPLQCQTVYGMMQVMVPIGMGPGMQLEILVPMVPPPTAQHRLYKANVTVPAGTCGGQKLHVQTPAGMMEVRIPMGLQPGMTFAINFPVPVSESSPPPPVYTARHLPLPPPQLPPPPPPPPAYVAPPAAAPPAAPPAPPNPFFNPKLRMDSSTGRMTYAND